MTAGYRRPSTPAGGDRRDGPAPRPGEDLDGAGEFAATAADLEAVKTLSARAIDPRFVVPVLTLEAGLALWEGRLDDAGRRRRRSRQAHGQPGGLVRGPAGLARAARRGGPRGVGTLRRGSEGDRRRPGNGRDPDGSPPPVEGPARPPQPLPCIGPRTSTSPCARESGAGSRAPARPRPGEDVAATWDTMNQPYPRRLRPLAVAEALLARRARSGPATDALRWAHTTAAPGCRAAPSGGGEPGDAGGHHAGRARKGPIGCGSCCGHSHRRGRAGADPQGRWRSCALSPSGGRTGRSPPPSSSAPRLRAFTSRTSFASWTCEAAEASAYRPQGRTARRSRHLVRRGRRRVNLGSRHTRK